MAYRTIILTTICLGLFFESHAINVTKLPHGLLQKSDELKTFNALYHLVIVFGNPGQYKHVNVTSMICNISATIVAEQFPGMEYASVLLEQLLTRYQA